MPPTLFPVRGGLTLQHLVGDNGLDRKRKRTVSPSKMVSGPKVTRRPRLSTPDPRTPEFPSTLPTPALTTDGSSVATAHSASTVLTTPDNTDERDGIVRGVAIVNPFGGCKVSESFDLRYRQRVVSQETEQVYDQPSSKRRKAGTGQSITVMDSKTGHAADHIATQVLTQVSPTAIATEEDDDEEEEKEEEDYETNDNWDQLEAVRDRLAEYNTFKRTIKGYSNWTPAQARLHKLLALRGCWPMLPASWAIPFSIRNIYPQVFSPQDDEHRLKRVAISSRSGNEFRATRALEVVFDLSAVVASYRQSGIEEKIGGVLKKALRRYIAWAAYDAGVEDRVYVPTLLVLEFDPRRWADRVARARARAGEGSDDGVKTEPTSEWDHSEDEDDLDSDPISDAVERRLRRLAARHREDLVTPESRHLPEEKCIYREQPPLLFAFVIVQHMVMVVSLDAANPEGEIVVFSELDMSLADQWLWNALSIALPVHMARDALWERRERLPVVERVEVDDPDL